MKVITLFLSLILSFSSLAADIRYLCTGTEPFWGAVITKDVVSYGSLLNPEEVTEKIISQDLNNNLKMIRTKNITTLLSEGECSDGMSEKNYGYHIFLQSGSINLNGCCNKILF